MITGKSLPKWQQEYPIIKKISNTEAVFWINPEYQKFVEIKGGLPLNSEDIKDAEQRWQRFAPYLARIFPETGEDDGLIESPLVGVRSMHSALEEMYNQELPGQLLLKCDNNLPVAGSIKARGGLYEVLKYAEELAIDKDMLKKDEDYTILAEKKFRNFFSDYLFAVGSTGNLGLSIGIMGARLGFKVTVHMSADAKEWKKKLLRNKGVMVKEYEEDYSRAVAEGRKEAAADPRTHFVDDERSRDLFLGYSVAACRLQKQLDNLEIRVDGKQPLFVYLPCGVGGGPGGITFGLKQVFADNVHCFFAEPTHSPSMLLGLITGEHDNISVGDFGIDNRTEADGLAVGKPSAFVGEIMENMLSGIYTVEDKQLLKLLTELVDNEDIFLEPSALAGFPGPVRLLGTATGRKYLQDQNLADKMNRATHIVWGTGGSLVPEAEREDYYGRGKGE